MAGANQASPPPHTISAEHAHPARAAAYLLGGSVHTQADRAFAESLVARWPRWTADLRAAETFLTGALRSLHGDGFDQVIDLSPVLPTPDGPYGAFAPGAGVRMVRLDHDPATAAQTAALLRGTPHRVVERDPDAPQTALTLIHQRRLLDLRRPVVLMAGLGALESRPTGSALERMLAVWGSELPSGSLLVFTHDSDDARSPTEAMAARAARARYTQLGMAFTARSGATLSVSLRNTGWAPIESLTWATRSPAPTHGIAARDQGRPDGRAASVLAGIAVHRPRHRTPTRHGGRHPLTGVTGQSPPPITLRPAGQHR
ncbi:SAM-dependent methyltransferase [Saccharothrix sp. NRRL B-16348]|uniref:SAM-dependent methyltransferase n=1 Tax=Saccharothrix sp. NRRL B-16348 TaxID=1415542 RepID=UPI0006AE1CAE|nr:SAM-dependent methyltransferase [Saccharothrix sp. NRRL B-16348]